MTRPNRAEPLRQRVDHVAGYHVIGAVPAGCGLAGAHVSQAAQGRCLERFEALGQQRADCSREYVAGALESLRERRAPTVLTPHEAELGRLMDLDTEEVSAHRLHCAREAAQRSGAIVLLKGHDTLVVAPEGPVAVSPGASPALATAGTGDVLSGAIGALLAKGLEALEAASLGCLAHARAGQAAARRHGADHVIAGDVIDALPEGFGSVGPRH